MSIFSPFFKILKPDLTLRSGFLFISSLLMCDDGTEVQFGLLFAALAPAAAQGRGAAGVLEP